MFFYLDKDEKFRSIIRKTKRENVTTCMSYKNYNILCLSGSDSFRNDFERDSTN